MIDDTSPSNDPDTSPVAIPWYQSKIMRGIVAGLIAQIVARLSSRYHLDITVLGFTENDVVQIAMDAITALAVYQTAHARVSQQTAPTVVLTKSQAATINAAASPVIPTTPAPPTAPTNQ